MNKIHDAAVIGAEWWARRVTGHTDHNNGDSGLTSLFAMALADFGQKEPSEEQLSTFKDAVIKGIEGWKYSYPVSLYCDYGPGNILAGAADEAGIDHLNFPFKTGMLIAPNEVKVKEGYGQPYTTIWSKNGEQDDVG